VYLTGLPKRADDAFSPNPLSTASAQRKSTWATLLAADDDGIE
jgi:hypothetical protein